MAASSESGPEEDGQADDSQKSWDGYSDFRTVSSRIGTLIADAVDAYWDIHSVHTEGAQIHPNQAANARSRIGSASMVLTAEMSHEEGNDTIDTILDRWQRGRGGGSVDVTIPDDGFIREFRKIRLYDDDPEWLGRFVQDFWLAGWELGYLKAGQHEDGGEKVVFKPSDVNDMLNQR